MVEKITPAPRNDDFVPGIWEQENLDQDDMLAELVFKVQNEYSDALDTTGEAGNRAIDLTLPNLVMIIRLIPRIHKCFAYSPKNECVMVLKRPPLVPADINIPDIHKYPCVLDWVILEHMRTLLNLFFDSEEVEIDIVKRAISLAALHNPIYKKTDP